MLGIAFIYFYYIKNKKYMQIYNINLLLRGGTKFEYFEILAFCRLNLCICLSDMNFNSYSGQYDQFLAWNKFQSFHFELPLNSLINIMANINKNRELWTYAVSIKMGSRSVKYRHWIFLFIGTHHASINTCQIMIHNLLTKMSNVNYLY